jgi:hypothetical protein
MERVLGSPGAEAVKYHTPVKNVNLATDSRQHSRGAGNRPGASARRSAARRWRGAFPNAVPKTLSQSRIVCRTATDCVAMLAK